MPGSQAEPTILVVEYNDLVLMIAADFFAEAGCKVVEATCGDIALRAIVENPATSLVFCDTRLPDTTGPRLLQRVQMMRPDIEIVLTAAYWDDDADISALPCRFMPKPYTQTQIASLVRDHVASGRAYLRACA